MSVFMQQHFFYIDRLKGFAILAVVMGHFLFYVLSTQGIALEVIGSFHMPLFMFLSGLVANVHTIRKVSYKLISFMMPLLTVGTLYAYYIDSSFFDLVQSPYKFGYWYLYVISVFYLFIYLLNKLNEFWCVFVTFALWGGILFLNTVTTKEWNDIFSLWILKQYWPFFVCGYFIARFSLMGKFTSLNWLYTLCFIIYIVSFSFWYSGKSYLYYIVAFSFVFAILYLFMSREGKSSLLEKNLEWLGRNTLDIYIYHFFLIELVTLDGLGRWLSESQNLLIEILLSVASSVLIAYLSIGIGKIIRTSDLLNSIVYGTFAKRLM